MQSHILRRPARPRQAALGLLAAVVAALSLLQAATAAETHDEVSQAQQLLLRGSYAEAAEIFRRHANNDAAAAIGLARCDAEQGNEASAIAVLRDGLTRYQADARLPAEMAYLSWRIGDRDRASEFSAAALKLDSQSLPARWIEAELLRTSGQLEKADAAYLWFADQQRKLVRSRAELDAEATLWLGLGIAQHARWSRNPRMFHALVNDFYPAVLKQNPAAWQAQLQMALLYAEKYNEAEARSQLAAALALNPAAADLHAAQAALAVRAFDVIAAGNAIRRAQQINPRCVSAKQLEADVQMIHSEPEKAIALLQQALALRPGDEATLGRLLGCYAAIDGNDLEAPSPRMQQLIEQASQLNSHCGELFLEAGDALDRMRRFEQAASFYREAQRRMPQLASASSQLGMTLMRLGDEAAAAPILEQAFKADPFHVRVKNTLEVLDLLQGYAVLETEHFVIKFDRGHDELLAKTAAERLEAVIYPEVVAELGYAPPDKTLFEIFSRAKNTSGHGWFSARMVGLPAVGTVGACAGKMVAITSPAELQTKYNWAQVLRHEFVHVVNLQQTRFNVPHWLTEGIAVHLEDELRPDEWDAILARRHAAGTLFTLDDILFGFVRPQQKDDWTLAYCQAELYVDYLGARYGDTALGKLLTSYGKQLSTAKALEDAFGISQDEFERGYREYVDQVVSTIQPKAPSSSSATEAIGRAQAAPENADAAAAAASACLRRDDRPATRRWAEAALRLQADHAEASYVLARLQLSIGGSDEARKLLEKSLDADDPHEDSLALLASLAAQAGEQPRAEQLLQLGVSKFPRNERWDRGLAKLYLERGDAERLTPILARLCERDRNNLPLRKKLAYLALESDDHTQARRWASEALDLDVQDAETHSLLAAAAFDADDYGTAVSEYETALQLGPIRNPWRFGLAKSLLKLGKPDEARRTAADLQMRDPNFPGLTDFLKVLP